MGVDYYHAAPGLAVDIRKADDGHGPRFDYISKYVARAYGRELIRVADHYKARPRRDRL